MPRAEFPPPDDVDKESKALWKKTIKLLEDQGTWQPSDVQTLERYIRTTERGRLAREGLKGLDGSMVLTDTGSKGQLVQHPNVKTAREAERDAHEYAKDLLLTPKAREQHQLEEKRAGKEGSKFGLD
jgi:P27 family predicted phage terminase small subunit